jgi:hypothetical protein
MKNNKMLIPLIILLKIGIISSDDGMIQRHTPNLYISNHTGCYIFHKSGKVDSFGQDDQPYIHDNTYCWMDQESNCAQAEFFEGKSISEMRQSKKIFSTERNGAFRN